MDNKIVFVHIPRTAGTSFGTIVADYFRSMNKRVCPYSNWHQFVAATDLDTYDLIGGHNYYPLSQMLTGPFEYITMLGDPINRLLSHLHFVLNGNEEPELLGLSFEDCLKQPRFMLAYNNFQTRQLGCDFPKSIRNDLDFSRLVQADAASLKIAKERLKTFQFVGIKELFNLSLDKFNSVFNTDLQSNNRSPRNWKDRYPKKIIDLATSLNKFDLELYEFGLTLFKGD